MKKIKLLYATPMLAIVTALPIVLTSCGDKQKYIKCDGKTVDATISGDVLTAQWTFELVNPLQDGQTLEIKHFTKSSTTPAGTYEPEIKAQSQTHVWANFTINNLVKPSTSGSFTVGLEFTCKNADGSSAWAEYVNGLVVNYTV